MTRQDTPPTFARRAMWRALLAGLVALACLQAMPGPVAAQTPVPVSVANLIRFCLFGPDGLRPPQTAFEMQFAVENLRSTRAGTLSQAAPGLYRFASNSLPMTLEMKLPGADGAGHCLVFGPTLTPADAAASADKFVEFGFLGDRMTALPTSGSITRRYTVPGLPYKLELVAYGVEGFGNIVGLTFGSVHAGLVSRQLAPAGAASDTEVQAVIGGALLACARHIGNAAALRPAIEAAGLTYERPTDADGRRLTYFGARDTVRVDAGGFQCDIESAAIQAGTAAQLVTAYLNAQLPGQFIARGAAHDRCATFGGTTFNGLPLVIAVRNPGRKANRACDWAGATKIYFEVAG